MIQLPRYEILCAHEPLLEACESPVLEVNLEMRLLHLVTGSPLSGGKAVCTDVGKVSRGRTACDGYLHEVAVKEVGTCPHVVRVQFGRLLQRLHRVQNGDDPVRGAAPQALHVVMLVLRSAHGHTSGTQPASDARAAAVEIRELLDTCCASSAVWLSAGSAASGSRPSAPAVAGTGSSLGWMASARLASLLLLSAAMPSACACCSFSARRPRYIAAISVSLLRVSSSSCGLHSAALGYCTEQQSSDRG